MTGKKQCERKKSGLTNVSNVKRQKFVSSGVMKKMKVLPLDNDDRKVMQKELWRHVFIYLILLFLLSIMMGSFGINVLRNVPDVYSTMIYPVFGLGYLGFVFFKLKSMISEYRRGVKHVRSGIISDKVKMVNYCWSGNPGIDLAVQPLVIEHYFTIDQEDVYVEDKYYDKFSVSDCIDIHYSMRTGRITKITKAYSAQK